MGFFKPAEDADDADESADDVPGIGDDDGSTSSSAEGEGSDALEDLGVDLGGEEPTGL